MNKKQPQSRSFILYIVLVGFAFMVVIQWSRLREAILYWDLLIQMGIQPTPVYLAITGAAWELIFLTAGVGLFLLQPWSINFSRVTTICFALWYWIDRILIARSDLRFTNLFFSVGITIFLFLLIFYILGEIRKSWRNMK